jgi:hypothetical protein
MRIFVILSLIGFLFLSCDGITQKKFTLLSSSDTHISFNNLINETEQENVGTYMNIYTGAGVGAIDINNDGLTDLFFAGNQVPSKLYLNKGDFNFEDITPEAGIITDRWITGVTIVDINQDGWQDIYLSVSGLTGKTGNLLYVNNHNNTFRESAASYGIADTRKSMHAAFFDYDRDNDLDLFIITNPASYENKVNHIQIRKLNGESESTDVLYKNNGDGTFTDVSKSAGIRIEGYSLGLAISDLNNDGWPDIYISNDFIGNDILYINNQDGTFTDKIAEYFQHTSFAGMGNDIADINNDGLLDVIELDMRPEDNLRQKLIIPPTGYDKYQLSLKLKYNPQFTRNTLQLNRGNNLFSEIAFLAGVSSTDWSWSPLLADYDNDGDKDLFVTNGFLRDIGNMDFIAYQNIYNTPIGTIQAKTDRKLSAIKSLEGAALRNYIFENAGNLRFNDQSQVWGVEKLSYSHGALYADLDADGDLDIVTNDMNGPAQVYRNNTNKQSHRNFLRIRFNGNAGNLEGIGARVKIFTKTGIQIAENFQSRGFESSIEPVIHFGLDSINKIDSLIVDWPDGTQQRMVDVSVNKTLTIKQSENLPLHTDKSIALNPWLQEIAGTNRLDYTHMENDYVDFKRQPLLPQIHSRNGPGIAVADVNGDGLEDFYIGGARNNDGALFIQKKDGSFIKRKLLTNEANNSSTLVVADEMGVLFLDADQDEDLDLYIVTGGTELEVNSAGYLDHLFLNDGNGNFTEDTDALPPIKQSGSSVVASDFDQDGDLDLFVAGRVVPGRYPTSPNSSLLQNDSKNGRVIFTDVTEKLANGLSACGMVTSALWTDTNNDGWTDLMVVGEFMPVLVFINKQGKSFEKITIPRSSGWWSGLTSGDYDQDGDMDYIVGNVGLNTRYRGTLAEPICIYTKDYDRNGSLDPVMTYYLKGEKYLIHGRDEIISQISSMKLRFNNYKDYAAATFEQSFLESEIEDAEVLCSERFETVLLKNNGGNKFDFISLPVEAQFAPVYGMVSEDLNDDGNTDVMMIGNHFGTEINTGRYDAMVGLCLEGNGKGGFKSVSPSNSGFFAHGDGKGFAQLIKNDGSFLLIAGNNNGNLELYQRSANHRVVLVPANATHAIIHDRNSNSYRHEFYYGSGYLSGSSRRLILPGQLSSYELFSGKKQIDSYRQ